MALKDCADVILSLFRFFWIAKTVRIFLSDNQHGFPNVGRVTFKMQIYRFLIYAKYCRRNIVFFEASLQIIIFCVPSQGLIINKSIYENKIVSSSRPIP